MASGYPVIDPSGVDIPNVDGTSTHYASGAVVPLSKLISRRYSWLVERGYLSEDFSETFDTTSITGDLTVSGFIYSSSTTDATSTLTGAIRTAGGLGVAKKAYFGDKITTTAIDVTTGDASGNLLKVFGDGATNGMAISTNWNTGNSFLDFRIGGTTAATYNVLRLNNGGIVQVPGTTDSSSSTTGTLQVSGGVGIAKKLYVGTDLSVTGTSGFSNTVTITSANLVMSGTSDKYITYNTSTNWQYLLKGEGNNFRIYDSESKDFLKLEYNGGTTNKKLRLLDRMELTADGQLSLINGTPTTLKFAKASQWGYSSGYRAIVLGDTATTPNNVTVSIGYDPVGNANGSFSGDGREVLFRNAVEFTTPDTGNTSWLKPLKFTTTGGVQVGAGLGVTSGGVYVTAGGLTVASGATALGATALSGALTVTGAKTTLAASVAGYASLNLPAGTAPSSPANGDMWSTTSGFLTRVNGFTETLATREYVGSRVMNLVTNGSGILGRNYNFSGFVFDAANVFSGGGSFKHTGNYINLNTDEYIAVDTSKTYRFQYAIKQTGSAVGSTFYGMVLCYDIDGNVISSQDHMFQANTHTTLAADLVPGATTVQLTSAANWNNAAGAATYRRCIQIWGYTNSKGYTYPNYTYTKKWLSNAYADGGISGNTITLSAPWPATWGTIPAGTAVSNGDAGGTYKYVAGAGDVATTTWTTYTGEIGDVDLTGRNATYRFSPGTAFVRLGWLLNYNSVASSVLNISAVALSEVSGGQVRSLTKYDTTLSGVDWFTVKSVGATPALSVDVTNYRVGVGKTAPTVPLDVVGAAAISGSLSLPTGITGNLAVTGGTLTIDSGASDSPLSMKVTDGGFNYMGWFNSSTRKAYMGLNSDQSQMMLVLENGPTTFAVTAASTTFSGTATASSTTDSSSTTTGSLITAGGIGAAKQIYAGNNIITTAGQFIATNNANAKLKISRTNAANAPTTLNRASAYIELGAGEWNTNSYRLIALGYSGTYMPAYMGFQETDINGSTKGDLIFGTRSVTTDTVPDERLRIASSGLSTFAGDVTVSKASPVLGLSASSGTPSLNIDSPAAAYDSYINFRTGTSARWSWAKGGTESGTNAGSDLYLYAYNDAGALLSTPLTITRSTGALATTGTVTLASSTATAYLGDGVTSAEAALYIRGTTAGSKRISFTNAGATTLWSVGAIGTGASPSLSIQRYVAGAYTDTPIDISNSTGEVAFSTAINQTLTTDSSSSTTGALKTAGGLGVAKKLYVGTDLNISGVTNLGNTSASRNLYMSDGYSVLGLVTIGRSGAGYGTIGDGYRTTGVANTYNYDRSDYATMIDFSSGNFNFQTAPPGTTGNAVTFTSRLNIANTGAITTSGTIAQSNTTDSSSSTTGALTTAGGLGVAKKLYVGTDLSVSGSAALTSATVSGTIEASDVRAISDIMGAF